MPHSTFQSWSQSSLEGNGPIFRIAKWLPWERLQVQQRSLLALLDGLHRERLDPAPWVGAFAEEHRGTYRQRLRSLADRLSKGGPLVESLEQTPDALSEDMVIALRLGSQSGTVSDTYSMLLEHSVGTSLPAEIDWRSLRAYWMVLGVFIFGLLSFFGYVIAPNFRELSENMEWELSTLSLVSGSWLERVVWIGGWLLFLGVASIVLGWSSRVRRWIRDVVMPKLGWTAESTSLAPTLRMLAVNVKEGRPIIGSLSTLAKYHHNHRLRQRLLLARNEIEQGMDGWESLHVSGILSIDQCRALQQCGDTPSQAWLMQKFAESHEIKLQNGRVTRAVVAQPLVVLAFGSLVLWFAYSVFGTLYGLAQSLT
jgi:general secretion pathway protein F